MAASAPTYIAGGTSGARNAVAVGPGQEDLEGMTYFEMERARLIQEISSVSLGIGHRYNSWEADEEWPWIGLRGSVWFGERVEQEAGGSLRCRKGVPDCGRTMGCKHSLFQSYCFNARKS